jgi:hypothetical protein
MWSPSPAQRIVVGAIRAPRRGAAFGLALTLCTLVALFVARPASAALVYAGMCGTHAQSVVAPPISRAAPEIPLAPIDCSREGDAAKFETQGSKPAPPPSPPLELTPRLPALVYRLPPAPRLLVPVESGVRGERAAHRGAIERPPR